MISDLDRSWPIFVLTPDRSWSWPMWSLCVQKKGESVSDLLHVLVVLPPGWIWLLEGGYVTIQLVSNQKCNRIYSEVSPGWIFLVDTHCDISTFDTVSTTLWMCFCRHFCRYNTIMKIASIIQSTMTPKIICRASGPARSFWNQQHHNK